MPGAYEYRVCHTMKVATGATPYNSDTGFRAGQAMGLSAENTLTDKGTTLRTIPTYGIVVNDVEGPFTDGDKYVTVCVDGDVPVACNAAIAVNKVVAIDSTDKHQVSEVTLDAAGTTYEWVDGYLISASGADGDQAIMRFKPMLVTV